MALIRDEALNPKEQFVRQLTRHELNPKKYTHPDPKGMKEHLWPERKDEQLEAPSRRYVFGQEMRTEINARVKHFKELLAEHGWRIQAKYAKHRIRIEGFHPSGAVCMVVFHVTEDRFEINRYVLTENAGATWRAVDAMPLRLFVEDPKRKVKGRNVTSRCTCEKTSFSTEKGARRGVMERKMTNMKQKGLGVGGHVYRCSDEDRAWHFSKQPAKKWRYVPPKGLWKEQGNA